MREDRSAANGIAASLDSAPAHQIDPATKPFLEVFLECAHFKKPNVASRQKFDKQIQVAFGPGGTACHGTKKIDTGNVSVFTNGAHQGPDFIQRRR
jgi:hypothetical protein